LSKSQHKIRLMKFGAARFFQRREEYQPPETPADSPFRRFTVSCLKCGSFKLQVIGEFDSEADKSFRHLTLNSSPRSRRRGNPCSARRAGGANNCRGAKTKAETLKFGKLKLNSVLIREMDSLAPARSALAGLRLCQIPFADSQAAQVVSKTIRPVSGFFPTMPGRDFPGPKASHRQAARQVCPHAGRRGSQRSAAQNLRVGGG
jgi:hypothetical protein